MVNTSAQRQSRQPESSRDARSIPANSNQALRQGNIVPMRKRQGEDPTDANPFHDTFDEEFRQRYDNPLNKPANTDQDPFRTQLEYRQTPIGQVGNIPRVSNSVRKQQLKVKHEKKASGAKKTAARLRLTAINGWIVGWAMFWYLAFQLPFAFISSAGFGIAGYVYSLASTTTEEETVFGTIVYNVGGALIEAASAVIAVARRLFNFDFDPLIIFVAPFAVILILMIFQLTLAWFMYSAAGIKSLSGEKSGIKNMMFLLAGVGVVIPFFNLLPLILLWMLVVWKYPK